MGGEGDGLGVACRYGLSDEACSHCGCERIVNPPGGGHHVLQKPEIDPRAVLAVWVHLPKTPTLLEQRVQRREHPWVRGQRHDAVHFPELQQPLALALALQCVTT